MTYTVLQPTLFDEVWLSPALGFDVAHATARVYRSLRNKISWISVRDVAQFSVAALDASRAQHSAASDSLQQSFAVLMLSYASGEAIDMTETLRLFAEPPLKSVREHVRAVASASAQPIE